MSEWVRVRVSVRFEVRVSVRVRIKVRVRGYKCVVVMLRLSLAE